MGIACRSRPYHPTTCVASDDRWAVFHRVVEPRLIGSKVLWLARTPPERALEALRREGARVLIARTPDEALSAMGLGLSAVVAGPHGKQVAACPAHVLNMAGVKGVPVRVRMGSFEGCAACVGAFSQGAAWIPTQSSLEEVIHSVEHARCEP